MAGPSGRIGGGLYGRVSASVGIGRAENGEGSDDGLAAALTLEDSKTYPEIEEFSSGRRFAQASLERLLTSRGW